MMMIEAAINGLRQRQKFPHTIQGHTALWCIFCLVTGFVFRCWTSPEFSKKSMTMIRTLRRVC
ncbi:hypothetical protein JM78_08980 [Burkholderia pyrrocinia]|nr:hypothetical protein JM78_08980 [Burkholderia pyrrocinia]